MKLDFLKPTFKIRSLFERWAGVESDQGRAMILEDQDRAKILEDQDRAKVSYGKAVLNNGELPTNFSINLGAAPCNHSCLFCPQSVEKPKKAQWLDMGILEKVLNEMPEENILLNLSSYNETITAPNLIPAVELMKRIRPKLPIAMASNGSIYREKVMRELIRLGLDHYSFSFDAATKDDYRKLMQVDDYDKAWTNLSKLVSLRQELNSSMKITTHIMGFRGKEAAFEEFKSYWEDKVDAVIWRRVSNWGSDNYKIEERLAQEGFVSDYETPTRRTPCTSIFMHFKLSIEGLYYPCVAAVPAYDKHLVEPIGHASEITFMEAWNKLSQMRQDHMAGNWDKYDCCKTCNVWSMWDDMWFEEAGSDGSKKFFLKEISYAK